MSDNAPCPYCDKPRGDNRHGIMATCGSNACFRAAMRDARAQQNLPLWGEREIDFQNGFAAHNLRFRQARHRIVT